jgi:hypothetical protein
MLERNPSLTRLAENTHGPHLADDEAVAQLCKGFTAKPGETLDLREIVIARRPE